MAEVHQLSLAPLTAHAFNVDRSKVAVCENTTEAVIYNTKTWKPEQTLSEHDKLITSIDWAPRSNRIVTCAQDRNAYVWTPQQDGTWKPTLVLLRINRSATFVRWSPSETKFAVASGARTIAVCSFDEESDWWIAKHLKKPLRSTVLSLDWHPNDVLLAAGSADMKARVFSAFLKGDEKPAPSNWGSKLPFNTVCAEYSSPSGGWVHSVAFSPSGDFLAFAAHDSTINIVYPSGPDSPPQAMYTIRGTSLSYMTLTFINEETLVAAGHDSQPVLFAGDANGWDSSRSLDDASAKSTTAAPAARMGGIGRLNNEAFNRFKAADSRGVGSSPSNAAQSPPGSPTLSGGARVNGGSTERVTIHQNTITSVRPYEGQAGAVTKVSTSGVDGRLVIWKI